jgi:arabinofuranosyltransferase
MISKIKNLPAKISIVLIIFLGFLITYFNRGFMLDDALIYYRYVNNFIEGNGLVYNIGEKFNALTSPLYTYLSIFVSSITREVEKTQVVLSGSLLIASSLMLLLINIKKNQIVIGVISSLILVSSKFFYLVTGLETYLFVFLSLVCIYLYIEKKYFLLSVFSSLLFLTRGEGIFLLLILLYLIYRENRSEIKIIYFFVFASFIILNYLFNLIYYGNLVPHTLMAKIEQGQSGLWGGRFQFIFGFNYMFSAVFNNQPFYFIPLIIFALIGFTNHIKERFCLIIFLYSCLLTIFYTALNVPSYHWYYSIHYLNLYIFVGYGIFDIWNYLNKKIVKQWVKWVFLFLIFSYPIGTHIQIIILLQKDSRHEKYLETGKWFKNNTPKDSKIACVEVGHIGWVSERYIIDILGLVSPYNADFLGKKEFDKWFEIYKPDYILIHDPPWVPGHEESFIKLKKEGYFEEEQSFNMEGIKILKSTGKK